MSRNIIGYFNDRNSDEFKIYTKIASIFRNDCTFYVGVGEWVKEVASVHFKDPNVFKVFFCNLIHFCF